jgi:hypothetical protein
MLCSNRVAYLVWNRLKSRDIRDCIKIGQLSKYMEDVNLIVNSLKQYKIIMDVVLYNVNIITTVNSRFRTQYKKEDKIVYLVLIIHNIVKFQNFLK